ncbi:MAG: hypothetical protein UH080_04085 [Ruminococcus sp.]|nr:hypothetical protein [Ruminococcus sp.]
MNDNFLITQTEPNEDYTFNYTTEELTPLFKLQRKATYKKSVRCLIVLSVISILTLIISAPQFSSGFAIGALVFAIISTTSSVSWFNKTWKTNTPKIAETTYEYKIYDNYFILNLYRNNEKLRQSKCYFEDIQQVQKLDKWLLLQFGGQLFILRESDLKENSVFLTYVQKNPKNKK